MNAYVTEAVKTIMYIHELTYLVISINDLT